MKQIKFISLIVMIVFLIAYLLIQAQKFGNYEKDYQKTIQVKSDSIKTLLSEVKLLKNDFGYKIHNIWKETGISIPNNFNPQYLDSIEYYRIKYKIPSKIVYRIIWHESRFIDTSYNKSGATGLFQIKKCYWYQFRDNEIEWNEFNRIRVALKGLKKIYDKTQRWDLVISTYGCGHYDKKNNRPAKCIESYVDFVLNENVLKNKNHKHKNIKSDTINIAKDSNTNITIKHIDSLVTKQIIHYLKLNRDTLK